MVVEPDVSGAGEQYPSDLADEQWALVEPLLPAPRTGPKGGRREKHPRRRTVDAIMYVVRTGCAWRQLPHDFPPWQTVYWYFVRWNDEGTVTRIHDALRNQPRSRMSWRRSAVTASQSPTSGQRVPPSSSWVSVASGTISPGRRPRVRRS